MDTLEALRLYVTIAETGSFSAAARQVSVSTSTVTVALQQLEEQARVTLITRCTRRLSFWFEGRRFLADARKLLADWDASIAGVQDGPLRGPIRMTATQDFGRTEVAPLIDRFLDLHPAVQIALHLSDGVVDLVEQDIDLALRNGPLADSALKARLMLRGRRVVCARHPIGQTMLHPITQMTWPRTIASSTRALDRPFLRGLSPLRDDRLRFVLRAIALPTMAAFFANGRSTATASSCETIWISARSLPLVHLSPLSTRS